MRTTFYSHHVRAVLQAFARVKMLTGVVHVPDRVNKLEEVVDECLSSGWRPRTTAVASVNETDQAMVRVPAALCVGALHVCVVVTGGAGRCRLPCAIVQLVLFCRRRCGCVGVRLGS